MSSTAVNPFFLTSLAQNYNGNPLGAIAELLDNARDAKAKNICVEATTTNNGTFMTKLSIIDDGEGMTFGMTQNFL